MPDASDILPLLAAVAVKALVLVAMGAIAAWALRRSSAACRHVLWTAVLASVLVVAVTAPVPPMWPLPWGYPFVIPGLPGLPAPDLEPVPGGRILPAPQDARAATDGRVPATHGPSFIGTILVLIWLAGLVALALRIAAGHMALRRIAARGRVIGSGPLHALRERLAGPSPGLGRVRMIETGALCVPATWGVLRPVVAWPAAARAWPTPRLEAALRHELAHVRRRDVLTRLGADICCALLWFHPAVWFAARRMRWESERACDDSALASGDPGIDYAEWLVALARDASRGGPQRTLPSAGALTAARGLEARIRAVLDPATTRSTPRMRMASVPAAVLVATVPMAGLDLAGRSLVRGAGPAGEPALEMPAPHSTENLSDERVPLSPEQERAALARRFRPRNEREARAIERLREATGHEKQHPMDFVRDRAIWALWVAREDEVVGPLAGALDSADWRVRAYAAWCLGVVGAGEARERLAGSLGDPVWRVRAMAATALAGLADPRSTHDMLPLLEDPAWQVRLPVVEFLSALSTPEAQEALRVRLNDPHVAVRSAAEAALRDTRNP